MENIFNALGALKTAKFWKEFIIMTIGMLITAIAVYYFLVPSKLIVGTTSGLAIVVSGVFEAIGIHVKVSVALTIINVILLIMAFFMVDGEFGVKTVYASLILGPFMDLFDWIYPYTKFLTEPGQISVMGNIWFDLLCFVFILSAAQAILFSINGSTGGLDILGKIVSKYCHMEIGTAVSIAGAVVACTAFAINPFQMVVIGLIGTWLNGIVIDYFTASLSRRKSVSITTDNAEPIRKYIIEDLVRGCSIYETRGGYSGDNRTEIRSIMGQSELASLLEYIKENKINAFVTAQNVNEVTGIWFSSSTQKRIKRARHDS